MDNERHNVKATQAAVASTTGHNRSDVRLAVDELSSQIRGKLKQYAMEHQGDEQLGLRELFHQFEEDGAIGRTELKAGERHNQLSLPFLASLL